MRFKKEENLYIISVQ